ncbi:HdeD family acid-resistance protein [Serratia oryzae]|uniref:HdeD family acid-resistance protein n=1 Tax=Serratia oryzae TaxID=2034155 RepID=UPI0012E15049|nr:HdeD family acid-resistance protein [Serratia oryzae]
MLNIDRTHLLSLQENILKKQRVPLLITAALLLLGGILCLLNPFASGVALSVMIGVFLLLSGLALIIEMFINRAQNTWPMIGGILLGLAYLMVGYVFISNPTVGILALAVYLAVLFALGGIARLIAGFIWRGSEGRWLQVVIGILDLAIAGVLIGAGPETTLTLVTAIVGIEMLISAFSLFQVANRLK